jgi:hypothetical protein
MPKCPKCGNEILPGEPAINFGTFDEKGPHIQLMHAECAFAAMDDMLGD